MSRNIPNTETESPEGMHYQSGRPEGRLSVLLGGVRTFLDRKAVFPLLVCVQVALLYGLLLWGYQSNNLPYWFDNFVQNNGVWVVFGRKEYSLSGESDALLFDPRLDFVMETRKQELVSGYLIEWGDDKTYAQIGEMGEEPVRVRIADDFRPYIPTDRLETKVVYCLLCTIDDFMPGDWVYAQNTYVYDTENEKFDVSSTILQKDEL